MPEVIPAKKKEKKLILYTFKRIIFCTFFAKISLKSIHQQCSHSRRIVRDSRRNFNNRACFKYHTRAFTHVFRTEKRYFHRTTLLGLLFWSACSLCHRFYCSFIPENWSYDVHSITFWPYRYFGKFPDLKTSILVSSCYNSENTFNILEIKYFRPVTF